MRAASKAGHLPRLRWTPASPTGKDNVPLDDFEWSELRRSGTSLSGQWRGEMEAFAHLLEQFQKGGTPVLLSALPEPNSDTAWWGARPGPEGSQALLREIHQSFAAHHLNDIVWVWEPAMAAPGRDPTRRGPPIDDFYPGPLSADLILLDQPASGRDGGWVCAWCANSAGPNRSVFGLRQRTRGSREALTLWSIRRLSRPSLPTRPSCANAPKERNDL